MNHARSEADPIECVLFENDDALEKVGGFWVPISGTELRPVSDATWYGASAYCEWLGKRLPSESEWEKSARGTDGKLFPWGYDNITCDYAVYNDPGAGGVGCGTDAPLDVCSKSPQGDSPYGLCDMLGNASEWVEDTYHNSYVDAPVDGSPWTTGGIAGNRVRRGGSYAVQMDDYSVSRRGGGNPEYDYEGGFRCASICVPDCEEMQCGDDGCGGSCGECDEVLEECTETITGKWVCAPKIGSVLSGVPEEEAGQAVRIAGHA